MYVCKYISIYLYLYIYICIYMYMYIMYMYMYVYIYIYTYRYRVNPPVARAPRVSPNPCAGGLPHTTTRQEQHYKQTTTRTHICILYIGWGEKRANSGST